jgi:hypothetical protein
MQRRISTSLRDSAIRAFLAPTRLAKRMPQAFEGDQRRTFVSSTVVASSKQVRVRTFPHSEIPVAGKGMKRGETENMLMREAGLQRSAWHSCRDAGWAKGHARS